MKTLEKTMTEFVMENNQEPYVEGTKYKDVVSYAKFLSTPLTLGMFIPVDEYGNVLEEPEISFEISKGHYRTNPNYQEDIIAYQKALSNVLFEGFQVDFGEGCVNPFIDYSYPIAYLSEDGKWVLNNLLKTIEDLVKYKLKLTNNFKL